MLRAKNLSDAPKLSHAFFSREGGCSSGIYDSLNCGLSSLDTRKNVLKNRAICAREMGVPKSNLITAYQQHTAKVIIVSKPWAPSSAPVADALVTNTPDIALAVLTADCVPILFYEPNMRIIAAAHAGWKGALSGVIDNTINAIVRLGGIRTNIIAAIGPCILSSNYEIDRDLYERFCSQDKNNNKHFKALENKKNRYNFDLGNYVYDRVISNGLALVQKIDVTCTQTRATFFSYRKSINNSEDDYGRQLSSICMHSKSY